LIGLNTGDYQAIDLSQWIASNPGYLLADHFGIPESHLAGFQKERVFIAPPDGHGRREVK
jgi:oxalate decarboxylase